MLDLADEQGIPTHQSMFDAEVLIKAAEVFISSTAGGVMPVTRVNENRVGDGKPGRITALIQKRYREAHDEDRWTTPVKCVVD